MIQKKYHREQNKQNENANQKQENDGDMTDRP